VVHSTHTHTSACVKMPWHTSTGLFVLTLSKGCLRVAAPTIGGGKLELLTRLGDGNALACADSIRGLTPNAIIPNLTIMSNKSGATYRTEFSFAVQQESELTLPSAGRGGTWGWHTIDVYLRSVNAPKSLLKELAPLLLCIEQHYCDGGSDQVADLCNRARAMVVSAQRYDLIFGVTVTAFRGTTDEARDWYAANRIDWLLDVDNHPRAALIRDVINLADAQQRAWMTAVSLNPDPALCIPTVRSMLESISSAHASIFSGKIPHEFIATVWREMAMKFATCLFYPPHTLYINNYGGPHTAQPAVTVSPVAAHAVTPPHIEQNSTDVVVCGGRGVLPVTTTTITAVDIPLHDVGHGMLGKDDAMVKNQSEGGECAPAITKPNPNGGASFTPGADGKGSAYARVRIGTSYAMVTLPSNSNHTRRQKNIV
jgi:hypothetical protein